MQTKRILAVLLSLILVIGLCACSRNEDKNTEQPTNATVTDTPVVTDEPKVTDAPVVTDTPVVTDEPVVIETVPDVTDTPAATITVTDMIGREVEVTPGSYTRVVCIGAGALRMYTYIGSVDLLCGVEDID
ncbi:MAG: hypothetical protein J5522_04745, partial [Lachnospiraceae bacterium]|nr:hypothetical protein [Lachnospiraceae bacterium]